MYMELMAIPDTEAKENNEVETQEEEDEFISRIL